MKKVITALTCAAVFASSISLTVSAETDYKGVKLPFTVEAPANVSLNWLKENDSPTTMNLTYSVNKELNSWLVECADSESHDAAMERLQKDYGLSDVYVNAQIDWAIDDPVNGWHYTKYWDGEFFKEDGGETKLWTSFGKDRDFVTRVGDWDLIEEGISTDIVTEHWILRGNIISNNPEWTDKEKAQYNEWWYGTEYIPGLKNQLKDDQYTLYEVDSESHDQRFKIDWTQHTAYVRVRLAVTACKDGVVDEVIFSDWSEVASYGKEAKTIDPLTVDSLAPPVITNLRYYQEEFNGYPQIAVTLTVSEELSKAVSEVQSNGGGITIEWEARVPGGTWVGLQGDWTIRAGEQVIALQNLAEEIMRENSENGVSNPDVILKNGSPIELRVRYYCNQYESYGGEYLGEFNTGYSEVLTFGAPEMSKPEEASVTETSVSEESKAEVSKVEEKQKSSFPWWIIIVIILIIIIIIIIIILLVMKKKKKDDDDNDNPPANTPATPKT